MEYRVSLTESANEDLAYYETRDQRIIVAGIMVHLGVDAGVPSRKRKELRPNLVAPWELRIGSFRVFYEIEDEEVTVIAIGDKEHNELRIRGTRVEL